MKKLIILMAALIIMPMAFALTATRDLPSSATANTNFNVVVTLSGYSEQAAAIVRENIPNGCSYVSGGTLEGSQIKTVLGSLTSNTLTYTIKCASGTYSFSGTFDGGDLGAGSVGGENSLTIGGVCTDSSWSPETSTVCSGTSFTQTSNCGNTRSATGTKSCQPGTVSISRDLPSSATADTNFNVVLALSTTASQSAVIVRDNIPAGCTHISGGTKEGSQIKTVLGTLTSNSLTYTLKCPSGTYSFSGTFDGGDLGAGSVGGDSSLTIGTPPNCNCTSWSNSTCGSRTCDPAGCAIESKACGEEEETCEDRKGCEFWESCNSSETKCQMAGWVYFIIIGFIIMIVLKSL